MQVLWQPLTHAYLCTSLPFLGQVELSGWVLIIFIFSVVATLGFEFVNGFHDTANAVATVIYTKTLKPTVAIIWSGICNFCGVFFVGTSVAMGIVKLIPLDKLLSMPVETGAMLLISILVTSILWNLGTWYLGIPLSSTHTLIGAMIGGALSFSMLYGGPGVDWSKAGEIGLSLLVSPVFGFGGAATLMWLEKKFIHSPKFFHTPMGETDVPPTGVRMLLIGTCTLVSFFHGSNDGQKGVGLLMLILIVFLPMKYAFNPAFSETKTRSLLLEIQQTIKSWKPTDHKSSQQRIKMYHSIKDAIDHLGQKTSSNPQIKLDFRQHIQRLSGDLEKVLEDKNVNLDQRQKYLLKNEQEKLQQMTSFAPVWVLMAISLSLGLGTMIGWKRIVVTIGEKIGNEHLNYAEGATAEIIAATTIGLSTGLGLPVSTTHVLSSGVAGAMASSKGKGNLNFTTLKNIGLAWLLTLPASVGISFGLFYLLHLLVKS